MEVYVDVLFLENVVMNYLILLVTAKFSKSRTSALRLLLGATVGACYVLLLVLFPNLKLCYTTVGKVILSFAMIALAFSPEKIIAFIKTTAIFYISTFIFAGAAFAFMYFNQTGSFIRSGIVYVYWQSKWSFLFLSIIMTGIIIKIFQEYLQSRVSKDTLLLPLKITFESRVASISALVDTGNSLHDPLTNTPVIVVEFKAIKDLLPGDIQNIFLESIEDDLTSVTDIVSCSAWFSRFRLIPFTSLGMENGMLIGFKPDYIEIGEDQEKKGVSDVIICIYNRTLSKNNHYRALLSPELVV